MDEHSWGGLKTGTGTGGVYGNTIPPCAHIFITKPLFLVVAIDVFKKTPHLCILNAEFEHINILFLNCNHWGQLRQSVLQSSQLRSMCTVDLILTILCNPLRGLYYFQKWSSFYKSSHLRFEFHKYAKLSFFYKKR